MEQISTPDLNHASGVTSNHTVKQRQEDTPGPKPLTLILLRQFARCCVPVNGATGQLSTMVAN